MPDRPGGGGPGTGDSGVPDSDGSYTSGDRQSKRTDAETYLRGAQPTDQNGIVRFTSIYPGWYFSRTVHIHLRIHLNKRTVRTSQLYFDDALNDRIFADNSPYDQHKNRDTRNDTDFIYDQTGLLVVEEKSGTVYAALNLGIKV